MQSKSHDEALDQLELFRSPPSRPLWRDLPEKIKTQVRSLTVQMLKAYAERDAVAGEEVGDE